MLLRPSITTRGVVQEIPLTLAAGLIVSDDSVSEPACASTTVKADSRRNWMFVIMREGAGDAEVTVKRAEDPSMGETTLVVSVDSLVRVRAVERRWQLIQRCGHQCRE